ncbi:MAG TPA: DUF4416 family protein [Candidatus Binatia bacterium]|jgi:hypothetical protein
MGTAREPGPAKYFAGLLSSNREILAGVETDLVEVLGEIDGRSVVVSWAASEYYEREMGSGLLRGFVSFSCLASPEDLATVKLRTQQIEDRYRTSTFGSRRVNLDPGYVDAYKVVLASTKNAGQRLYLRSGIYAEATLIYHDGDFHGLAYTYPDYLWAETLAFFTRLRAAYLEQLRRGE